MALLWCRLDSLDEDGTRRAWEHDTGQKTVRCRQPVNDRLYGPELFGSLTCLGSDPVLLSLSMILVDSPRHIGLLIHVSNSVPISIRFINP